MRINIHMTIIIVVIMIILINRKDPPSGPATGRALAYAGVAADVYIYIYTHISSYL